MAECHVVVCIAFIFLALLGSSTQLVFILNYVLITYPNAHARFCMRKLETHAQERSEFLMGGMRYLS